MRRHGTHAINSARRTGPAVGSLARGLRFVLPVGLAFAVLIGCRSAGSARRADNGPASPGRSSPHVWKSGIPLEVANPTDVPATGGVTRVTIEIRDDMRPDLGDIRVMGPLGREVASTVSDVRKNRTFDVIFEVSVPPRARARYTLLYGNPSAQGRDRLSLALSDLNAVPNPGFETGDPEDPLQPTAWSHFSVPPRAVPPRSEADSLTGKACLVLTRGASPQPPTASTVAPQRWPDGATLMLIASAKARELPLLRRTGACLAGPAGATLLFPKQDHDWMTLSTVFASSSEGDSDRKSGAGVPLLAGWRRPSAHRDSTLLYDDVFLGRYFALDIGGTQLPPQRPTPRK